MTRELADDLLGRMVRCIRPEWTVRETSLTESGTDAVYYITAETPDGPVECVLKVCTAVPPADFRPEPYIHTLLERRTEVPVPHVVGAVDDHEDLPSPFYLMARCEGVTAESAALSPASSERVARAAGRYAGDYHRVGDFGRFGRLRLDCDLSGAREGVTVDGRSLGVAVDGHDTWRSWVESLYDGWLADLDERFVDLRPELESFVHSRLDTLDRPFDAVLGHIDYKPWNVLVRPETGTTTAVLDWGHATAMAPYYDLILKEQHLSRWAPLDSSRRRRVRVALEEGYAETNELERDPDFDERRELYLLGTRLQPLVWFSEWMSDASETERQERAEEHRQFVHDLRA